MKRSNLIGWLVLSILALLYCLYGIMMAYWVATLPDQSAAHVRKNFIFWISATSVFVILASIFGIMVVRRPK